MVEELNIRELRQRKRMTLLQAAETMGCSSKGVVWQWEAGRGNPRNLYQFNILLKAYDVHLSADDLLKLEKTLRKGIKVIRIKFKVVTD